MPLITRSHCRTREFWRIVVSGVGTKDANDKHKGAPIVNSVQREKYIHMLLLVKARQQKCNMIGRVCKLGSAVRLCMSTGGCNDQREKLEEGRDSGVLSTAAPCLR